MALGSHRRPVEAFSILRATELHVWSIKRLAERSGASGLCVLMLVG